MIRLTTEHGFACQTFPVRVYVTGMGIVELLQRIAADPDFDHKEWSIMEAELLEQLARKIRQGYGEE